MFNSRWEDMHISLLNVILSSSECPNVGERLVIDRNLWFAAFIIWHSVLWHTSLSILQEQRVHIKDELHFETTSVGVF